MGKRFFVLVLSITGLPWSGHASEDALSNLMRKYGTQTPTANEPQAEKKTSTKPVKTRAPAATAAKPIKIQKPQKPIEEKIAPVEKAAEVPAPEVKAEADSSEGGLFGDWGGLKPFLKSKGVDLQLKYKADAQRNTSGGLENKGAFLSNVDVTSEFDMEKIAGAKGLTFWLYGLGNFGDKPTRFVGDSFGSSNIEAPNTFKLYEAWLKQAIDDRFSVLAGLRDLNADYYAVESTANLINSAFGISPTLSKTGVNGPSIFPVTALALTTKYESPNSFYFQSSIFNARAGNSEKPYGTQITTTTENGYLFISETGVSGGDDKRHKYALGAWTYTEKKEALDPDGSAANNSGFYLLMDQSLTSKISFFAKYGNSSATVNQFSSSIETGFLLKGLFHGRESDQLSFGYAQANVSDDYRRVNDSKSYEAVAEITYRAQIAIGLFLTPDFQYVINPGVSQDLKNAQIIGSRLEILF